MTAKKPTQEALQRKLRKTEKELRARNKAFEELRKSEERYRIIADTAYYWETWRALDGNYLYVSPSFERITGYRPQELAADPRLIEKIAHPEDQKLVAWHFREELDREEAAQMEFRIITRKGEERWINHTCRPVHAADGSRLGYRSSNRDFTLRKEAEEALRESEEKYRTLFNESRDAIYITSRDGKFLDANQALMDLFGYTREELLNKVNVKETYVRASDRERFRKEIENKGSVRDYEIVLKKEDWTKMDCLVTASVRRSSKGEILGYQGIIRDITTYRIAQEALKEREARYRAIVEAFDGLIYICSQDYRVEFMNHRYIERTGYDGVGELCYKALHDLDSICP